jgi:hypothetical protein
VEILAVSLHARTGAVGRHGRRSGSRSTHLDRSGITDPAILVQRVDRVSRGLGNEPVGVSARLNVRTVADRVVMELIVLSRHRRPIHPISFPEITATIIVAVEPPGTVGQVRESSPIQLIVETRIAADCSKCHFLCFLLACVLFVALASARSLWLIAALSVLAMRFK